MHAAQYTEKCLIVIFHPLQVLIKSASPNQSSGGIPTPHSRQHAHCTTAAITVLSGIIPLLRQINTNPQDRLLIDETDKVMVLFLRF